MKIFFSEYQGDYDQYHFPYQVFMEMEHRDDLARVYNGGFLPFRSKENLYYLSRSTRVKLSQYEASSENRRILKKMEPYTYTVQPIEVFQYTKAVQQLCVSSVKALGGTRSSESKVIPTAAIRKLFTGQANCNYVMSFVHQETAQPVGYVAIVAHDNFIHYAHPFSNPEIEDKNVNIGMMTLAVEWAYNQHKQHIYLGTSYTSGSLYKAQFRGFEFFNGITWSPNLDELKYLIHRDSTSHLIQDPQYDQSFGPLSLESALEQTVNRMSFK